MFVQPLLTTAAAAKMAMDTGFKATFSGAMYASPLYLEHGPGGNGVFFAVTVNNDVIALDETTGATIWTANIGPSPTAPGVPCGNVKPVGIISTPVIDAAAKTIYVAGAIGTSAISRHEVHALSVMDGAERPGFPVVVAPTSGSVTFAPSAQNQRSALSLVNGILYVAYGGHSGDCGVYHGWVVAIDTKNPKKTGAWATLGQGEGIWAAGGLASDGDGVFAVTGNSTVAVADHLNSDSEEVLRITGLGVLDRSPKNLYFPNTWHTMDGYDSDFGASNPMYLEVPGGKPDHIVFALSKDGQYYFLDPANLGGMGGQLFTGQIALGPFSIKTVPAAYTSSSGLHVVMSIRGQGGCPVPRFVGPSVLSMVIAPGVPPRLGSVPWCSPIAGAITGPIATTTDGTANAVVWYMSDGKLLARDGDTGQAIFDGGTDGGNDACSGVHDYTSPIAVKGRIIVGGDGHLCSWSVH
jgi:hypothetical protein